MKKLLNAWYWSTNRLNAARAYLRWFIAPKSVCLADHPRMAGFVCDKRKGHRGQHADRLMVARFRKPRGMLVRQTVRKIIERSKQPVMNPFEPSSQCYAADTCKSAGRCLRVPRCL